jgi:hypothetical protein
VRILWCVLRHMLLHDGLWVSEGLDQRPESTGTVS